jgi:hypothetical protein
MKKAQSCEVQRYMQIYVTHVSIQEVSDLKETN